MSDKPDAKVLFRVGHEDGSADVETLWAYDLGQDRYKLDNSPFYAYSVSWEDIVHAPFNEHEERPAFERVIEKSGNRTIRIIFEPPVEAGNDSDKVLQSLVGMGCSYEGATPSYIAVNIPPAVDLEQIRNFLIDSEANWEHADPSYKELFGASE